MKRFVAIACIALIALTLCPATGSAKVKRDPGGIPAFLVGCCWGIREGSEWNEGADMHWREWCRLIPFVNILMGLWDGVDCYGGITAHEWAEKNGANWY